MSLGLSPASGGGSAGYVIDHITPSPSVHDPPGHAGTRGHCRRRMALAPLHQHSTQESAPQVLGSPLANEDVDLDLGGGERSR